MRWSSEVIQDLIVIDCPEITLGQLFIILAPHTISSEA